MKIITKDFINEEGAQFQITADNDTERVLLTACIDPDSAVLSEADDDGNFLLLLPVSNG